MRLVFAERARQDIQDIYETIAASNCLRIADFLFASAPTDEPHIRRLPIVRFPYRNFFRVRPDADLVRDGACFCTAPA